MPFDITDEAAVTAALDGIRDEHGRLDILVNNAGLRDRRSLFELELDAVRRLIEVDLVAPFNLSRAAAQIMTERGWGRIVNVTSIVAAQMACSERSTSPAVLAHEVLNTASPRHFVGISQHTPAGSSPPPRGARHQDPTFGVSTA